MGNVLGTIIGTAFSLGYFAALGLVAYLAEREPAFGKQAVIALALALYVAIAMLAGCYL